MARIAKNIKKAQYDEENIYISNVPRCLEIRSDTMTYKWYICAGASQQTDDLDWWKRSESFVMIKERCHYFSYVHSYSDKCFVFFFLFFFLAWKHVATQRRGSVLQVVPARTTTANWGMPSNRLGPTPCGIRHQRENEPGRKTLRPLFHLVPAL